LISDTRKPPTSAGRQPFRALRPRHDPLIPVQLDDAERGIVAVRGQPGQRRRVLVALPGEFPPLGVKLDEDRHLVADDLRIDRLQQVIDRARLIPAELAAFVGGHGGEEDDRHPARALCAAHQLGQLEAVHARHLHVEQR
jgi:hypothetical protein